MEIIILRHAEANHLLENWKQKVCYHKFNQLMAEWEDVPLTQKGLQQAEKTSDILEGNFDLIYSSPLKRAIDTARIVNKNNRNIILEDLLKEIRIHPPRIFRSFTFSINSWIILCTFFSFFNGNFSKYMKQARDLFDFFISTDSKRLLVVSHSARIHSMIMYVRFCSYLKLLSSHYKPCGISVVRFNYCPQSHKSFEQQIKPNT